MAVTDIDRISSAVNDLGSGIGTFRTCDSTGSFTSALVKLPWIKTSSLNDTTDQVDIDMEGGERFTRDGVRTVELQFTFGQQDIETIKMATQTLRGSYIQVVKEISNQEVDGGHNYFIGGICKVNPSLQFTQPGGEVQLTLRLEKNTSTLSVGLTNYADTAFQTTLTGTVSVGANKYWELTQIV